VPPTSLVVPRLAEAKIIIGGPRTCRGWGGNAGSINTDECFDTCASQGSSWMVSTRPVLGRVIRRADTGSHTQQPLITVGDVMIIEHFVQWSSQALKTTTDSSGLWHDHQHSYYYALNPVHTTYSDVVIEHVDFYGSVHTHCMLYRSSSARRMSPCIGMRASN